MTREREYKKEQIAEELEPVVEEAQERIGELGLNPREVRYWINHNDEINQLSAYGGFQKRYPHWRWGMKYDKQQKQDEFRGGKIFEMVINNDPCHAYLQMSNDEVDQKAVITHVEAHSDFFANNRWYQENPQAVDMLARHAEKIEEYMNDPNIEREEVEKWIDHILCLEDNIDQNSEYIFRQEVGKSEGNGEDSDPLGSLGLEEEIEDAVFDDDFFEQEESPHDYLDDTAEDILAFLIHEGKQYDETQERAVDYEDWQIDILDMLREESYYFAPQKMTKIMNEGWACVGRDTNVVTEQGILSMEEVVENEYNVSDGERVRNTIDSHIIEDRDSIEVETSMGYRLLGSLDHRIMNSDGEWVELQDLQEGDSVKLSGGTNVWPSEPVEMDWELEESVTVDDVLEEAGGYSTSTWYEYQNDRYISEEVENRIDKAIDTLGYRETDRVTALRKEINIPGVVGEEFGEFLGMLIADGHITGDKGEVGFTYGRREVAERFKELSERLFDCSPSIREDHKENERWRVNIGSVTLAEFLIEEVGLTYGKSSGEKTVPECIRRSPKNVVSAFLSAYISCDGHVSDQPSIVHITKCEDMSEYIQSCLMNFGIVSTRHQQSDGCWRIGVFGSSLETFDEEIGLIDEEKQSKLSGSLAVKQWSQDESFTDEVVSIEETVEDVYDITVHETHRYEANGFLNHNSYTESLIMTDEEFAEDSEIVDYADQHSRVLGSSGLNPYRLGKALWEHIENTVNRRDVVDKLLRIDGINPDNFHRETDFQQVHDILDERDSDDVIVRNYSLTRLQNQGFIQDIGLDELRKMNRYIMESERYESVEGALEDVDYTKGWERMKEVRETHNDVMFIDEFLTQEFVDSEDYFTYEYRVINEEMEIASRDVEDIKKKLLLQLTNFGKPKVEVATGNFDNSGELLLLHRYNGVVMDLDKMQSVLERMYEMWGRPVNIATVGKHVPDSELDYAYSEGVEPEPVEIPVRIKYDGEGFTEHEINSNSRLHEELQAEEVDYSTKPEEWL